MFPSSNQLGEQSPKVQPYCLFPRTPGLFSSLNVQKNMLSDTLRMEKFKKAIFETVKRGDVVIDLGTGTGIFAVWAAQAGARKVFAVEETDMAGVAESVVAENGLQKTISIYRANSSKVCFPEPADVLIAEIVGHFFFEEGIVEYVADVRNKLLKSPARIIPCAASIFLVPVELGNHFQEVSFWKTFSDPKLSCVSQKASNTAYVESVFPSQLLSSAMKIFELEATTWESEVRTAEFEVVIQRDGILDALAGWFELQLSVTTCIATSPSDPATHWKQCIFPLDKPVFVSAGDRINCSFALAPFAPGCRWRWSVSSVAGNKHWEEVHDFEITYGDSSRLIKERF
jgi:Ribosomal protein L11 methyltransferase (PrmA)/PRMT5 oligomerisation domain